MNEGGDLDVNFFLLFRWWSVAIEWYARAGKWLKGEPPFFTCLKPLYFLLSLTSYRIMKFHQLSKKCWNEYLNISDGKIYSFFFIGCVIQDNIMCSTKKKDVIWNKGRADISSILIDCYCIHEAKVHLIFSIITKNVILFLVNCRLK